MGNFSQFSVPYITKNLHSAQKGDSTPSLDELEVLIYNFLGALKGQKMDGKGIRR